MNIDNDTVEMLLNVHNNTLCAVNYYRIQSHFTHVIVSVCNNLLQLHLNLMTVDMLCIIHVAQPSFCVHFQLSYYNIAVAVVSGAKKYRHGTLSSPPPSLRFLSSLFPPFLTFSPGCIVKVNTCELFNVGQIVFSTGFKICSG